MTDERLYQLYLRFRADTLDWYLSRPAVAESATARCHYAKACEPDTFAAFGRTLARMVGANEPGNEVELVAGFEALVKAQADAAAAVWAS